MNVSSLINSRRVKIHYHLDRKNARRMPPITAISKKQEQVKSVQKKNYNFVKLHQLSIEMLSYYYSYNNIQKKKPIRLGLSENASDFFSNTDFSLHSHNLKKHRKRMSFQQRLKCHRDQMLKIQKLHSNMYAVASSWEQAGIDPCQKKKQTRRGSG